MPSRWNYFLLIFLGMIAFEGDDWYGNRCMIVIYRGMFEKYRLGVGKDFICHFCDIILNVIAILSVRYCKEVDCL